MVLSVSGVSVPNCQCAGGGSHLAAIIALGNFSQNLDWVFVFIGEKQIEKRVLCLFPFFFSFLFLDITKILFHSFAPVLGRFLTYQILSPLPSFPLLPSRSLQGG